MKNWAATFPLLDRSWLSLADRLSGERFAQSAPTASPAPLSSASTPAEPATAVSLPGWLEDAQWQATPARLPELPPASPVYEDPLSTSPFERVDVRSVRDFHRRPMGPPFLNEPPRDYPSHLGPVPRGPDWEQVVLGPTPWSPLAPPPRAADWGRTTAAVDEAAEAEDARRAAAMRTGQWRRRNQRPYEGYTAPPPTPPADDSDPGERARLNFLDAFYWRTLFGAGRLALMKILNGSPDDGVAPP